MSLKDDERRDFNCTLVISSQVSPANLGESHSIDRNYFIISKVMQRDNLKLLYYIVIFFSFSQLVLVGTDDGLYAFNPQALTSKRKQMTQLTGFGSVHQMALAKGVDLILVLTGKLSIRVRHIFKVWTVKLRNVIFLLKLCCYSCDCMSDKLRISQFLKFRGENHGVILYSHNSFLKFQ